VIGDVVVEQLDVARLHPRAQRLRLGEFPQQIECGELFGQEARHIVKALRGFDVAAAVLAGEAALV
jgi:hypothetical protein